MNETPLDPSKSNPTTHKRPRSWENDYTGGQVTVARNDGDSKSCGDESGNATRIVTFETNYGSETSSATELIRQSSYNVTKFKCYEWLARQISQADKLFLPKNVCSLGDQHQFLIQCPLPTKRGSLG